MLQAHLSLHRVRCRPNPLFSCSPGHARRVWWPQRTLGLQRQSRPCGAGRGQCSSTPAQWRDAAGKRHSLPFHTKAWMPHTLCRTLCSHSTQSSIRSADLQRNTSSGLWQMTAQHNNCKCKPFPGGHQAASTKKGSPAAEHSKHTSLLFILFEAAANGCNLESCPAFHNIPVTACRGSACITGSYIVLH